MFYKNPQALTPERHTGKSIRAERNYRFATDTNSVPLNLQEFVIAGKTFPIVFTIEDPAIPVAVLGLGNQQNLFVDDAGNWVLGAYIPAYIRRYPFIFTTGTEEGQLVLCVDEDSEFVEEGDDRPLFVDGEPSDVLNEALQFCNDFQSQFEVTKAFVSEIDQHDLLVSKEMTYTSPEDKRYSLAGFRIIDEEKFNALDDDVFLEWRRRGWLPFLYCHFLSVSNLVVLGLRASQIDSMPG